MLSACDEKRSFLMSKSKIPVDVGIVVIGRNEGERLKRCLNSLVSQTTSPIVYVDSGSTDESVEFARGLDVYVEELDTSIPFTMARGRNTGFHRLLSLYPDLCYVQFVDGDCEVEPSWIAHAVELLRDREDVCVVCGFRRERFRDASIYNRLIDLEWQGPAGEVSSCGGDAMYRVKAFKQSGGFNEMLIAGEEPELCVRLRQAGGIVWRLNEKMVAHDAALYKFSQWWTRVSRSGYAYAEGAAMHGTSPQRHFVRELARTIVHGLLVPCGLIAGVFLGFLVPEASILAIIVMLIVAAFYTKSFIGAYRTRRLLGNTRKDAILYSLFCMLGKLPEAQGALKYFTNRALGKRAEIIEYKMPSF